MPSLDELRGYYVRSPRWVQSTGGRLLSAVPPRVLYGGSFRELLADIERSEWDSEFVEQRVRTRLGELFSRAGQTRYYSRRLSETNAALPTLADLAKFPVLGRDEVRHSAADMLAAPRASMDEVMTSGTTSGVGLSLYLDKDRGVKEWAFLTHVWSRCGFRPRDRRAVLALRSVDLPNTARKPWAWEPGTRELRLSPFRMIPRVMDEYLELIGRFRIAFIYGYPSAITILATHARKAYWSPPPTLKGVLPISESTRPHQRQAIREGFGPIPVVGGYGLTEKVALAGEIPGRPDEYQFEPLYGVTEVIDAAGRPLGLSGQQGRLVGTGFLSKGMPLIRYDTGDLATLVEAPSAGNCWRLRVENIVSCWKQEYLVTREGGLVTPTALYPNNRLVKEFRFVQVEPGLATLRVLPEEGVDREQFGPLLRKMNEERTDGLLTVDLEIVDEIPPSSRGKRRMVEQRLDLSQFGFTAE